MKGETRPARVPHLSVQGPLVQFVSCSNPAADLRGLFPWFEGILSWQDTRQLLRWKQSQPGPSLPAQPSAKQKWPSPRALHCLCLPFPRGPCPLPTPPHPPGCSPRPLQGTPYLPSSFPSNFRSHLLQRSTLALVTVPHTPLSTPSPAPLSFAPCAWGPTGLTPSLPEASRVQVKCCTHRDSRHHTPIWFPEFSHKRGSLPSAPTSQHWL